MALPGQRLKDLAIPYGIDMGSITADQFWNTSVFPDSAQYQEILKNEFSMITIENEMKFSSIRYQGRNAPFAFDAVDQHVAFAEANGLKVHGHTLIWYLANSDWLYDLVNNWTGSSADLRSEMLDVMYEHIDTVAGRYKGKIYVWDVLNEVIPNYPLIEGTRRGEDSTTYCPWYQGIGPDFIELALLRTRQVDPAAKLIINDYLNAQVNLKSDLYYELVQDFKNRNIPLDGLGMQMHLRVVDGELQNKLGQPFDMDSFSENLQRFSELGIEIFITELDIAMPIPFDANDEALQAQFYDEIFNRALSNPSVVAFQTWGFTDKYSWVEQDPELPDHCCATLLDYDYEPKSSYLSLQSRLEGGVSSVSATKRLQAEYHDESFGAITNYDQFVSMGSDSSDDWLIYQNVDLSAGFNQATMRYARPHTQDGVVVEIRLDSSTGPLLGTFALQSTGGGGNFIEDTISITETSGTHDVYFKLIGTFFGEGNFDWFRFEEGTWSNEFVLEDDVSFVTGPSVVTVGQAHTFNVSYESTTTQDILITLEDTSNGWVWHASDRVTVEAGRGSVDMVLYVDSNAPLHDDYHIQTILTDVGAYWNDRSANFTITPVTVTAASTVNDLINGVSGPSAVTPGQSYTITVDYEASETRDILVTIEDPTDGWVWYGNTRTTVVPGQGSIDLTLTVDANAPAHNDYQIQTIITEVGGYWNDQYDSEAISPVSVSSVSFADSINNVSGPSSVTPGQSYTITVDYEASETRDILVTIEDPTNGWAWHGNARATVSAGQGSIDLTLTVDADTPIHSNYQIQTIVTEVGGYWGNHFGFQTISPVTVSGGSLNLLENGGFEDGLNGWGNGGWSLSSDAFDGNNSATISGQWYVWLDQTVADSWGGSGRDISELQGRNVTLKFFAKHNGEGSGMRIGMQDINDVVVTGTGWAEYTVNGFVPSDANSLKVFIEPQGGVCHIDGVRLTVD